MLDKFIGKYKSISDNNKEITVAQLGKLYKLRQTAYVKIDKDNCKAKVIDESKAFIDFSKYILLNVNIAPSDYFRVLEYMSKAAPTGLDDNTSCTILQYNYDSLRQVFKELKKHPMKAGIKVRFVKESMAEVKATLDKSLPAQETDIVAK
jgi:hypothetical protein